MTESDKNHQDRKKLWLCLEPVDALFFRDGRPLDLAARSVSGLPNPQVLAGALRTEMLRCAGIDLAQLADCVQNGTGFEVAAGQVGGRLGEQIAQTTFRGPCPGRKDQTGKRDHLFYPAPATLRRSTKAEDEDKEDKGKIVRLDPLCASLPLPGWASMSVNSGAADMLPLWARDRNMLKPLDRSWITQAGMSAFLSGRTPSPDDLVSSDDLYDFEDRTGIAIDPGIGVAGAGMFYTTRRLVLRAGVRFWAQVEGPDQALDLLPGKDERRLLPFGGEGRQVILTSCDPKDGPLTARAEPARNPEHGRCLVLITPAFLNGWCPSGLDLLSAAVPGHVPVSGWDLARGGPKPTRFAVTAGSVYFLRSGTSGLAGSALGDIHDTSVGWGAYCEGVWHHAPNL